MVTVGVYIAYIDVKLHYSIVGTHTGRYLTLAGFLGRARACHQTRGGVGIIVHIPGHRRRLIEARSPSPEYAYRVSRSCS